MYGFIIQTGNAYLASVCMYRDGGGLQREETFTSKIAAQSWLRERGVMRVRDYSEAA